MSGRETTVQDASTPVRADFSKTPLPPEGAEGEAPAKDAVPRAAEEVAAIEFLDPASMHSVVTLRHPFRWEGRVIDAVTVRRLSFAETLRISEAARAEAREATNMDFFAAMTGLPSAVIRAMEFKDADRLTDACLPFFPRDEEESGSS